MLRKLIERPIAVTMSLIAVMVLVAVSLRLLPVSLMPDVDIPQITVQISSTNLSARELDASVVKVLRYQLQQVSNLTDIRTETKDGSGMILLKLEPGTDVDFSFIEVNEKIDRAMSSFSREIERPKVIKTTATDIPAFYLNLTLKNDSIEQNYRESEFFPVPKQFMELCDFATQVIVKRIEQLPTVALVDPSGLLQSELLIIPDEAKIASLNISQADFEAALRSNNIELGNLTIRDGEYQYNVRFESLLNNRTDIENTYLNLNGSLYQIKDLAQVIEHPQKRVGLVKANGKNAVTLAIIKQSEAKMADLKKGMSGLLENLRRDYPDIAFELTRDQTQLLDYSINNLKRDILIGALLASLVLFFFMRDIRTPLLITLTIPVALGISLLFFYLLGISVNIISLSGLVLGIGMMVDNSIIVIDNISQWWDRGNSLRESVVRATKEVFAPMLSSVLTTCSVFVPLIFLSGIAGALFYDQAMGVTISLFSSLLVAVTVIPVYYYMMYRKKERREENRFMQKLPEIDYVRWYETGVKWVLRHQVAVWGFIGCSVVCGLFIYHEITKEKLPPLTQHDAMLNIEWNERISLEENALRTEKLFVGLDSLMECYTAMVGIQQFMLSHTRSGSQTEVLIYLLAKNQQALNDVKSRIFEELRMRYPEAVFGFESAANIFDIIFSDTEPPLVARLRSTDGEAPDPDKLNHLLTQIDKLLPDTYIESVAWEEHLLFVTRPDLLSLYNVSFNAVNSAMKKALNENQLFMLNDGKFMVPVILGDQQRSMEDIVRTTFVTNSDGIQVPLSSLVVETRARDLKNIISGQEGDFYPLNLSPEDKEIQSVISKIDSVVLEDRNFEVGFSGSYFSNRVMLRELMIVLMVSLLLLYFILAAQFESLIQPLIILSEIITDILGALLFLWFFGASINLMSLIGLVVMCGIVINDSILKVDTINRLRIEGYSLLRAIMMGGSRRIKPILMTSLTTILSIAPFLVRGDMGSDLQYPLSLALIGGMIIGTAVSLFFVPVLYYVIYKNK